MELEEIKQKVDAFRETVPRLDLITCMGEHNVIEAEKFIAE